eukprot:6208777-Pleurochrysis_carterae.AAC.2
MQEHAAELEAAAEAAFARATARNQQALREAAAAAHEHALTLGAAAAQHAKEREELAVLSVRRAAAVEEAAQKSKRMLKAQLHWLQNRLAQYEDATLTPPVDAMPQPPDTPPSADLDRSHIDWREACAPRELPRLPSAEHFEQIAEERFNSARAETSGAGESDAAGGEGATEQGEAGRDSSGGDGEGVKHEPGVEEMAKTIAQVVAEITEMAIGAVEVLRQESAGETPGNPREKIDLTRSGFESSLCASEVDECDSQEVEEVAETTRQQQEEIAQRCVQKDAAAAEAEGVVMGAAAAIELGVLSSGGPSDGHGSAVGSSGGRVGRNQGSSRGNQNGCRNSGGSGVDGGGNLDGGGPDVQRHSTGLIVPYPSMAPCPADAMSGAEMTCDVEQGGAWGPGKEFGALERACGMLLPPRTPRHPALRTRGEAQRASRARTLRMRVQHLLMWNSSSAPNYAQFSDDGPIPANMHTGTPKMSPAVETETPSGPVKGQHIQTQVAPTAHPTKDLVEEKKRKPFPRPILTQLKQRIGLLVGLLIFQVCNASPYLRSMTEAAVKLA